MGSARILAAILFVVSLVAAFFPEPLILTNLTRDEFMRQRWEHRRHDAWLSKRAVVMEEERNADNPEGQALVEARSQDCVNAFGDGMRCFRGSCLTKSLYGNHRMDIRCNQPPVLNQNYRHTSVACAKNQGCDTMYAYNYAGNRVKFPYCKDIIAVNKRPGPDVEIPPVYDGWKALPEEALSPGTIDFFFTIADTIPGLTASWEHRGHWSNGWGFLAESKGKTSSFACLGCPHGTLYVETVGFKAQAEGLTLTL